MNIDFDSLDVQKEYFHILDKIMDAIVLLRYEANRENNTFVSVHHIHTKVLDSFLKINSFNQDQILRDLASTFVFATRKIDKREYYFKTLKSFYQIYKWDKSYFTAEVTSSFYNEVLNYQQDFFCQMEKKNLKRRLIYHLPLTEKKEQLLIQTAKLKKVMMLLKEGKQNETPLCSEVILEIRKKFHDHIKEMRYFQKKNITVSEEQLTSLDTLFFMGEYTKENIASLFSAYLPDKVLRHIKNEYYQLLIPYLDDFSFSPDLVNKGNIPYDYHYFVIAREENFLQNKGMILELLKKEGLDETFLERKENQCFLKLLALPFLFDEFRINDFFSILKNSALILEQLERRIPSFDGNMDTILNQFHQVLLYAKSYQNTTPAVISVLGDKTVQTILNGNKMKSRDPRDYLDTYLKMLKQKNSTIPPISFSYQDYQFTSGKNVDVSRLLVGHFCEYSCIGPKGSGEKAFF